MRRSKYGNIKTHGFDSKAEYARWLELRLLEKGRKITDLARQVRFPLTIRDHLICTYVADFCYYDHNGHYVIEDVKGVRTTIYRLKKKLILALTGFAIREVSAKDLGIRVKR